MKKCGIYLIENQQGNKYVGQSIDIEKRWKSYKYFYKQDKKSLIHKSLKKYGYENHKFSILEECEKQNLNAKEIFYIELLKTNIKKYPFDKGFNRTKGADNPPNSLGKKRSEEYKQLLSLKLKAVWASGKRKPSVYKEKNFKRYNSFTYC